MLRVIPLIALRESCDSGRDGWVDKGMVAL